jgi:hypothetical protein
VGSQNFYEFDVPRKPKTPAMWPSFTSMEIDAFPIAETRTESSFVALQLEIRPLKTLG